MSGIEPVVAAALIAAGTAAATTGVTLATRPGPPTIEPPKPPPEVPPPAEPPPEAPTETEIDEGVATQRQRRQRAFGFRQTILAGRQLGSTGRASLLAPGGGRTGSRSLGG